jgi:mannose-6-phosphate isomerase-like protein (cupin superfamily)
MARCLLFEGGSEEPVPPCKSRSGHGDTTITRNMRFRASRLKVRKYNREMDENKLAEQLRLEGFVHTYVWQDGANTHYPDHTHSMETAHIILNGEMTLTTNRGTETYRAGERCDVPAGAVHSAQMGPKGCRYLIGER